jgi:hypothetical protein
LAASASQDDMRIAEGSKGSPQSIFRGFTVYGSDYYIGVTAYNSPDTHMSLSEVNSLLAWS